MSKALILDSVNPQYDERLFIEFPKNTSSEHVVYKYGFECQSFWKRFTCNNKLKTPQPNWQEKSFDCGFRSQISSYLCASNVFLCKNYFSESPQPHLLCTASLQMHQTLFASLLLSFQDQKYLHKYSSSIYLLYWKHWFWNDRLS